MIREYVTKEIDVDYIVHLQANAFFTPVYLAHYF